MNHKSFALLVCSLVLASCGGGGGGDDSPAPNSPPSSLTSSPALLQVAEDNPLTAQLSASDPNGDTLSYSLSAPSTHGTAAITAAGAVTYTPAANYNGADAFSAAVSDGHGGSSTATFNITVTAVNDAPTITGTTLNYAEDQQSTQNLVITDPEGDDFSVATVTEPAHGMVLGISSTGGILYQPDANFHGQDSFTARSTDEHGAASAIATVTINVASVNDAPVAADDSFLWMTGTQPMDVAANDTDVDGDPLTVSVLTQPAVGTVSVVNNRIAYQPSGNFAGPVQFAYRVTDAGSATADATVKLVVGSFPGLFVRSTRPDAYTFDGYSVTKWSEQYEGNEFAIAGDGKSAAYAGRQTQSDRGSIYRLDTSQPLGRPDNPKVVFQRGGEPGTSLLFSYNAAGTFLFIADPQNTLGTGPNTQNSLFNIATGDRAIVTTAPDVFTVSTAVFNATGTEFFVRAAVSNAATPTPNAASTYTSLFLGDVSARTLTRIGSTYAPGNGDGSGLNIRVTPNGRFALHAAVTHGPTTGQLLINDRLANTETYLYRAFTSGEFPAPYQFAVNSDGSQVCFRVNAPGAAAAGPGRIWIASPAAPGAATAVTPTADSNSDCQWSSDAESIGFISSNGAAAPEAWIVDRTQPNVVQRLRESLAAGETTSYLAFAKNAQLGVVAITEGTNSTTTLYRVALDSPGSSTRFASVGNVGPDPQFTLDASGNWLGYIKTEAVAGGGTLRRVHLASTQSPDTELVVDLTTDADTFAFMK